MSDQSKITCEICGAETHTIKQHLQNAHPEVSLEEYQARYPDAPTLSAYAIKKIAEKKEQSAMSVEHKSTSNVLHIKEEDHRAAFHEVFGLKKTPETTNNRGEAIPILVLGKNANDHHMVPEIDPDYYPDIDVIKMIVMGMETNIPVMIHGHAGTGKTSSAELVCAATNRPMLRIQHTPNMVETDITGTWVARDGSTHFELGPLALAMKYGWVLLADEYDRAYPNVLSVYQPILEGKPLVIKEADAANRIIHPHPHFRYIATGNTNGSGDEHALYPSTVVQDAANYSRFGITIEAKYLPAKIEIELLMAKAKILKPDAESLVRWAGEIRESFAAGNILATVGPRELIFAAKIGAMRRDFMLGVQYAILNRWSTVNRTVGEEVAQRIIGNAT